MEPVQKHVPVDSVGETIARPFFPDVEGLRLRKDVSIHMRWECYYPRQEIPRWCTRAFGVSTDRDALLYVHDMIWQWHTEKSNQKCPHELVSALE